MGEGRVASIGGHPSGCRSAEGQSLGGTDRPKRETEEWHHSSNCLTNNGTALRCKMNFATSAGNQLAQMAPLNLSTGRPLCGFYSDFQSTCFSLSWALRQPGANATMLNIPSPSLTELSSPMRLPGTEVVTEGCAVSSEEAEPFYQELTSTGSPPTTDWFTLSKWFGLRSGGGLPCPALQLADSSQAEEEPKPNFNYIGLIAKAILSATDQKMVLSEIYEWIQQNYPYFRNRGPGWRNSIRHNLSLNDCFVKVGRALNGKGHFWGIHPANLEDFLRGDYRRRRAQRKVRRALALSCLATVVGGAAADDEDSDSTMRVQPASPATTDTQCPHPGMSGETPQLQHLTLCRSVFGVTPPSEFDPWNLLLASPPPTGDLAGHVIPTNCSTQVRKATSAIRPAPFTVASFLSPDKGRSETSDRLGGSCSQVSEDTAINVARSNPYVGRNRHCPQ
ncbi:hypothetical protein SprV_0602147900 [Sparganum proliferum]